MAGTDITGLINNKYNADLNSYNQQQSDLFGGLFGLGKAAIGLSDKRLKENIEPTGEKVNGIPVKEWDWKATGEHDIGVVAQDVEKKFPHLVEIGPDGYRRVNYGRLMRKAA